MFEIRAAPDRKLIQSTLAGSLTVGEVGTYAREMEAVHHRWFRFRRTYRLVIDASLAKIQAQDVLGAFAAHITTFPQAEKIGVVCGPSLNRFQILRLLDRPYLHTCMCLGEAQRWVVDGAFLPVAELSLEASSEGSPAPRSAIGPARTPLPRTLEG